MAIVKLTPEGKVITKGGLPSCGCCYGTCVIEWDTSVYSGQLNGNPWVVTLNGSRIRVNIENAAFPESCDGVNDNVQEAEATATITIGALDVNLGFNFSGIAEEQETGFENISFYLNGVLVASATSPGTLSDGSCAMGPAVVTYHVAPPYLLPALSVNTLLIQFTTFDPFYHYNAYYEANFSCEEVTTP